MQRLFLFFLLILFQLTRASAEKKEEFNPTLIAVLTQANSKNKVTVRCSGTLTSSDVVVVPVSCLQWFAENHVYHVAIGYQRPEKDLPAFEMLRVVHFELHQRFDENLVAFGFGFLRLEKPSALRPVVFLPPELQDRYEKEMAVRTFPMERRRQQNDFKNMEAFRFKKLKFMDEPLRQLSEQACRQQFSRWKDPANSFASLFCVNSGFDPEFEPFLPGAPMYHQVEHKTFFVGIPSSYQQFYLRASHMENEIRRFEMEKPQIERLKSTKENKKQQTRIQEFMSKLRLRKSS